MDIISHKLFACVINILIVCYGVNAQRTIHPAIDRNYLDNLLDYEECDRQITAIRSDPMLLVSLADASGLRIPRGILKASTVDLGDYHHCLSIDHVINDESRLQGKYCSIIVSPGQFYDTTLSNDIDSPFNSKHMHVDEETLDKVSKYNRDLRNLLAKNTRVFENSVYNNNRSAFLFPGLEYRLAVCIPRPCTTEQYLSSLVSSNILESSYFEDFCRFPGDKTWSPADTAAVVIFSVLGVVTLISTGYNISYRFILKKDIAQINKLCLSFSVYTKGQRLTSFSSGAGTLQCLDGIRALAMFWVVIGHSYTTEIVIMNVADLFEWLYGAASVWITVAPMAVDMFFTLSGLLVVYTTAEKMNSSTFLRNIHRFYINRVGRITPLLAAAVLLEASLINRSADGPIWGVVEYNTYACRRNWWSTLLHVQNFVHPLSACLTHSWYLGIDMNLYIVSPLVFYWVLSNKRRQAWISLTAALLAVLVASTVYIFHIDVPGGQLAAGYISYEDPKYDYYEHYYVNVLARASPFFVGMMFGYVLHIHRNKKVHLKPVTVGLLWICVVCVFGSIVYFEYAVKRWYYDQPIVDNFMNSFMRPAWGAALCLVIFACVNGYGGPVNWLLCLDFWRMPSRLSYAIYLFHYPLMFLVNSTVTVPVYFSPARYFFKFLAHLGLSMVLAFVFTVLIDSPISFLWKQIMSSGTTKAKKEPEVQNPKEIAE